MVSQSVKTLQEFQNERGIEHLQLSEVVIEGKRCAQFPIFMWSYSDRRVGWYCRGLDERFHYKVFFDNFPGYYYGYNSKQIQQFYNKTICVVEGIIDAEILRVANIPAIAMLTAKIPVAMLRDLKIMKQSVLLIPDNDVAGKDAVSANKQKLLKNGIPFDILFLQYKDIGSIPKADQLNVFDQIRGFLC